MADGATVKVEGLEPFRKGLAESTNPRAYKTELRKEEKVIATEVAGRARAVASSLGGPYRHFAYAISGAATLKGGSIRVRSEANDTFWGGRRTTGWNVNAGPYAKPQHPEWVGASWDVQPGQGPYAIVPAIVESEPLILRRYDDAMTRVTAKAFPPSSGVHF